LQATGEDIDALFRDTEFTRRLALSFADLLDATRAKVRKAMTARRPGLAVKPIEQ